MARTDRPRCASGVLLALAMVFAACGRKPAEDSGTSGTPGTVSPKVLEAAAIADAIQAAPDQATAILEQHGMTAESFRDLMYEIAADEKMSADYEQARKR